MYHVGRYGEQVSLWVAYGFLMANPQESQVNLLSQIWYVAVIPKVNREVTA